MVQRQIHKWPGNFSASKTTVARLRQVLSDPETGFTKAVASVQKPRSPSPSLSILSEKGKSHFRRLIVSFNAIQRMRVRHHQRKQLRMHVPPFRWPFFVNMAIGFRPRGATGQIAY
jgi:hypothetical protein